MYCQSNYYFFFKELHYIFYNIHCITVKIYYLNITTSVKESLLPPKNAFLNLQGTRVELLTYILIRLEVPHCHWLCWSLRNVRLLACWWLIKIVVLFNYMKDISSCWHYIFITFQYEAWSVNQSTSNINSTYKQAVFFFLPISINTMSISSFFNSLQSSCGLVVIISSFSLHNHHPWSNTMISNISSMASLIQTLITHFKTFSRFLQTLTLLRYLHQPLLTSLNIQIFV